MWHCSIGIFFALDFGRGQETMPTVAFSWRCPRLSAEENTARGL